MKDYQKIVEEIVSTLSEHNQQLLLNYVRSKRLAGAKPVTICNSVRFLKPFFSYFGDIPYDQLTAEQIEDWYLWYCGQKSGRSGETLQDSTVRVVVNSLKPFVSSMHGEDTARKMTCRIKPKPLKMVTVKEEELLSDAEIKQMIESCNSERDRAIIAVLYSSGCRVGELCNLRIKDVTLRRESASLHLEGKTGERDIDIFVGVPELKRWLAVHPFKSDLEAYLFVPKIRRGSRFHNSRLLEKNVWVLLKRIGERARIPETKRVNPHSFRHKRATDLADHLTTADLRQMFGWADMSSTPNVYVHSSRAKVKRKLAEIAGVKVPESVAPSSLIRVCPLCGCVNEATATHCNNCWTPLTETQARAEQLAKEMMAAYLKELEKQNKKQGKESK